MTDSEIIQMAVEEGFAAAEIIPTTEIQFDPTFQDYCAENLCGKYNANYACPPHCGTPEQMRQRVLSHKKALVLQTIWDADWSDSEATKQAKARHNAASLKLMKRLRAAGCPGTMAGAGGCSLCSPCAVTRGEPCKFPDLQFSCMSAYCVFVKKLADRCGMEYTPGDGLIAFFGMYLLA